MARPKSKKITTPDGEVIVYRLALKDFAELVSVLEKLPSELVALFNGKSEDELREDETLAQILPRVIVSAIPEAAAVLGLCTNKDKEFFLNSDLLTCITSFEAALELNNYKEIYNVVKKMFASRNQKKAPEKA